MVLLDVVKTLKGICQEEGHKDYQEFCRSNGYRDINDVLINGVYKPQQEINLQETVYLYNEFYKNYNRFPCMDECMNKNKLNYNLPNKYTVEKVLKENNITLNDFL